MRGLNLSRLAARGKASESAFFKDQQAAQAAKLRASLPSTATTPASASSASSPPTVDTLASISAHTAYRPKIIAAPTAPSPSPPLLRALRRARSSPTTAHSAAPPSREVDPTVLRALGSARLSMYSQLPTAPAARPLPGGSRYADGAALGIASFAMATGVVASVGMSGAVYVYLHPEVVERLRARVIRFAGGMDQAVGVGLRRWKGDMEERGGWLSDSARKRAREIAGGVTGVSGMSESDSEAKHEIASEHGGEGASDGR